MFDAFFSRAGESPSRPFPFWVLLWAVLLPCLYLPTLLTRFDFIDDGNLVYPAPPQSPVERVQLVCQKIAANYEHLGPFRPVLWIHWETEADLLGANPFYWRIARLLWTGLATGAFLWLMRELGIRPVAAVLAVALAMWNPYRNEIWTSLTLSEGVAMPYALFGLVCALRAARSSRPWPWDVAGALCLLAALGCKNTFAAVVPVQMFLRIAPDGHGLLAGWRRYGRRASLLASTLLLPIGHYLFFKLNWHAGQYQTGASLTQLGRMVWTLKGAISADFLAPGLVLAVVAIGVAGGGLGAFWGRYRCACLAGLGLLVLGTGIYLPLDAVSGRYAMPAVWGLDLWIAALLSTLADLPTRPVTLLGRGFWKPAAYAALGCGLVAVAVANLGRQERFAARANLLWHALEWVERDAAPGTCVGWVCGPDLNVEEGIHFQWHLRARGRGDVTVCLLDDKGRPEPRTELPPARKTPGLLISGTPTPPGLAWNQVQEFATFYWRAQRSYHCYLYQRSAIPDLRFLIGK